LQDVSLHTNSFALNVLKHYNSFDYSSGSGNSSKAAAAISRLRGNKDVKSVEELEADLKQKEEAWAEMRAKVDVQQQQQHAKRQHHMQQQHQHHNAAPTKMENSEELSVFQKFVSTDQSLSANGVVFTSDLTYTEYGYNNYVLFSLLHVICFLF
jgi:TolA-binding protein